MPRPALFLSDLRPKDFSAVSVGPGQRIVLQGDGHGAIIAGGTDSARRLSPAASADAAADDKHEPSQQHEPGDDDGNAKLDHGEHNEHPDGEQDTQDGTTPAPRRALGVSSRFRLVIGHHAPPAGDLLFQTAPELRSVVTVGCGVWGDHQPQRSRTTAAGTDGVPVSFRVAGIDDLT